MIAGVNVSFPIITVDGPSGAGKGTLCHALARRYGFHLLDSGAIYRIGALASQTIGIDLDDEEAVASLCERLEVDFLPTDNGVSVLLNGQDVSQLLRTENVGMAASKIAAYPKVREALVNCQRNFAKSPGLVADGRDMGTTIFPAANAKIFLTASAEDRARRRVDQLLSIGCPASFEQILADIKARDHNDCARTVSPLQPADDALVIDSSQMTIDGVCQQVNDYLKSLSLV